MRVGVIINPFAGRGRIRDRTGDDRQQLAHQLAVTMGDAVETTIVRTSGPGDAAQRARRFVEQRFDRVVAWGGDGTVNEVAGPLLGSTTVLGIVPSGSGDGLAHGLGLPVLPDRALATAIGASPRALDVGFLGDRHFLNIGGIGFDAAVGRAFNRGGRHGALGYASQALAQVWRYQPIDYRLVLDDDARHGRCLLVAFANAREYGNRLVIAPDADPSDGWLNAVIVEPGAALRQVWRARRLFFRPLKPAAGVHRQLVHRARISADTLLCHVDGEVFESTGDLDVTIQPGALQVAAE